MTLGVKRLFTMSTRDLYVWVRPKRTFTVLYTPSKAQSTTFQTPLYPSNAMQMQIGRCKAIVPARSLSSLQEQKHQRMLSVPANETHGECPRFYLPSLTSCTLKCCPCTPCSCGIGGGGP